MNLVSELDLPAFDYTAPDFSADRYHDQLAATRQRGWLAKSPLAYIGLDRDAGEFFLRSRKTAFPGRQIAEFFGVTGGPLAEHIDANILNLTGEQHRRLRALVGPALTPRAADRWRPVMRITLAQLWARVAGDRGCDFVAAVARPYPSLIIATVLGAPLPAWAPTWPGPNSKRRWRSSRRALADSPWTGRRSWAGSRASTGSTSSRSSGRVHPR
jgi:cytochrome P450